MCAGAKFLFMDSYIKLTIAAFIPVVASSFFYLIDNKTSGRLTGNKAGQLIIGIVFGTIAIIGTEWGIPIDGAMVNCRDAAPICAGLFFGAPAGIIAGIIGGVERWIAVAWGVGSFTRLACSVSTVFAGVASAFLRVFMFERKKPGWGMALFCACSIEVFHLNMVFVTNLDQVEKALHVVQACTIPMVVANSLAVALSAIIIGFIAGEKLSFETKDIRISETIQRWLLVCVVLAFVVTNSFSTMVETRLAEDNLHTTLTTALEDTFKEVGDSEDIYTIADNRHVGNNGSMMVAYTGGIVVSSTEKKWDRQNIAFTDLADIFEEVGSDVMYECEFNGTYYYVIGSSREFFNIFAMMPVSEAELGKEAALYVNAYMQVLIFSVMFLLIYFLIKKVVVKNINKVNRSLAEITSGNLDVVVDVRSNAEFASLSDDINSTVDTLKHYIEEAAARIDKELEFAKSIQASALPSIFPAFPKRKDFDIYARMDTAKEVGGDFYDFYMTNNDTLNFLIADVSGKGIPAALFMMRAKVQLKTLTETDIPVSEVFTLGNENLCEGNDAGMFVTAWQGSIDLKTGHVGFANAGHNPPLVKHVGGKWEYLKSRPGLVLAGMEGLRYRYQELQLGPGDMIYLYTDGVTEATDAHDELYGEDRLLNLLNSRDITDMKELCDTVKADIDLFVGDAPQFDDITMVALRYDGPETDGGKYMKEITVDAKIESMNEVLAFVDTELEALNCPMKAQAQIDVAIDELFSNIAYYAYHPDTGPATVRIEVEEDPLAVIITFLDNGMPYDPLAAKDPDTTLPAEDRKIGGLGVLIVKKSMDDVAYEYKDGQNILKIKKNL